MVDKKAQAIVDPVTMSIHFGAFKLGVPDGFKVLAESITREVLREQPQGDEIPEFIASYLKQLKQERDEGTDRRFIVKKPTTTLADPPSEVFREIPKTSFTEESLPVGGSIAAGSCSGGTSSNEESMPPVVLKEDEELEEGEGGAGAEAAEAAEGGEEGDQV